MKAKSNCCQHPVTWRAIKMWTRSKNPVYGPGPQSPYFYYPIKTKATGMLDCWLKSPCEFTCALLCFHAHQA